MISVYNYDDHCQQTEYFVKVINLDSEKGSVIIILALRNNVWPWFKCHFSTHCNLMSLFWFVGLKSSFFSFSVSVNLFNGISVRRSKSFVMGVIKSGTYEEKIITFFSSLTNSGNSPGGKCRSGQREGNPTLKHCSSLMLQRVACLPNRGVWKSEYKKHLTISG